MSHAPGIKLVRLIRLVNAERYVMVHGILDLFHLPSREYGHAIGTRTAMLKERFDCKGRVSTTVQTMQLRRR